MPVRLGRFEMPKRLTKDEATATPTYAKYAAEPFEAGYGHTVGNSLRRVLLSSLEGAALTTVKFDESLRAHHEFATIVGVVEDVTDIILNLRKILFKSQAKESRQILLLASKEGAITAADIKTDNTVEIINPDTHICTLDKKMKFEVELTIEVARGFRPAEKNKVPDMAIGVIPLDSIFSPVRRVRYSVENTRVGQRTDYDKLLLEIWTDGRMTPDDALMQSSHILRHHLDPFCEYGKEPVEFEAAQERISDKDAELRKKLNMSVNEIELSVRAANCLNNANITTVGQLAMKTESEMLKYRNFGKKSLNEIKEKLSGLGLTLGMKFDLGLLESGPAPERPLGEEAPVEAEEKE